MEHEPTTLLEATRYFAEPQNCVDYVVARRWPKGVVCPVCGSTKVAWLPSVSRFQCSKRHPKRQFTVKTGSIFEDSPLPLDKWLIGMWLIVNAKNGISSYEIHRALGVTQKTAWFMLHRIRFAMQNGTFEKIGGHVEIDETYIGGKARNMHKHVKARKIKGSGMVGKTVVMGFLERGERVRTTIIAKTDTPSINSAVKANVAKGSIMYTDELASYRGMEHLYTHYVIDHAKEYVDGLIHTNGMENYWSLLKRGLKGTYVSVEPFHLHRYLDEQAFRYNNRRDTDGERFDLVTKGISGKRLTYKRLTGKELVQPGV